MITQRFSEKTESRQSKCHHKIQSQVYVNTITEIICLIDVLTNTFSQSLLKLVVTIQNYPVFFFENMLNSQISGISRFSQQILIFYLQADLLNQNDAVYSYVNLILILYWFCLKALGNHLIIFRVLKYPNVQLENSPLF